MQLEITKNVFLEIERISTLKNHTDKLVQKEIKDTNLFGTIEVDLSYQDTLGNECFKSLSFDFDVEIEPSTITDIALKNVNVFVVEGRGVSIEYGLDLLSNDNTTKEIEIIEIATEKEEMSQETLEKIKEDISKDYENKLADNLASMDNKIAITVSKNVESEHDFLRFFDDTVSKYYSIKTISCSSEECLNSISKEYKIPLEVLLKGYDRENGKVTFKVTK